MESSHQLIRTKLHVPRSANLVRRHHLLEFLQQNLQRKLTLVCAGPGYGKTSLLVDLARSTDLPICWYTLDPGDRDPCVFLDYLVESIRVHFASFGSRVQSLLRQGQARNLRTIVGCLVNELAAIPRERIILVLDEFQTVAEDALVGQAFSLLLEFLPGNVHVVVASRTIPPSISLVRLAARGQVAGISADMLRFTEDEVEALLRQQYGVEIERERVRELAGRSEGWVTGILLGAQSIWQHYLDFLSRMPEPDRVYDYLLAEVLDCLDPEQREFLVKVSILSRLEANLCDHLLGRQDSAQMLEWLEDRNLFLVPLEGGWYRFHGLFRESLLREARADQQQFADLNIRAAELWCERGEPSEAVEYLLQAGDHWAAARLIDEQAKPLFRRGRLQTLRRWTEAMPEVVQTAFPRLVLCRGKVALETGDVKAAQSLLEQAQRLLEHGGASHAEDYVQALADLSLCLRLQGSYSEALETARIALPQAEAIGAGAVVDLHRVIGTSLLWQGASQEAERHYRAALQHSLTGNSPLNQALAYQDLGVCLRAQGRMTKAEHAYRKALSIWESLGNPGPMGTILNNLAMGPFLRGQFDEAASMLQRALEVVDQSLSPYDQALVRASLGDVYRNQGKLDSAHQVYLKGLDLARQAHSAAVTNYLLDALGNLARLKGAYAEARRRLQEAQAASGSSRSDSTRVSISLGLLELAEGRIVEARETIAAAIADLESGEEQLQLLRAWLVQALVWHAAGRWHDALESLRCAEDLGARIGVIEPFLAEAGLVRPLLCDLYPNDDSGLLAEVQRRLTTWAAPHDAEAEEDHAHWRILALGPGRIFKNGAEIPLESWEGRQPREVFFYLYFCAPVPRDRLAADFWPDLSSKELSNRLYILLHRVRQTAGISLVSLQKETYYWTLPRASSWSDVEAFQKATALAAEMDTRDENYGFVLERALSLYQGHFLDEFYSDWCVPLREKLRVWYKWVLLCLGTAYLSQQRFAHAQEMYERTLQEDPFCEQGFRGLMRVRTTAGERALAIQTYHQCREHLAEELGVSPSPETQSLYEAVVRGRALPTESVPRPGVKWQRGEM